MCKLHRVSTPEIFACNIVLSVAEVQFRSISGALLNTGTERNDRNEPE